MREQEELGIFLVFLIGGEPFIRQDIWKLFELYPRTVFTVYTNGTLLGEADIERIRDLGNVRLLISLEGFESTTDLRRGEGVYQKVRDCMLACQKANILFGASITVTRNNFVEVTSNEFVEAMVGLGVLYINFLPFIPMGGGSGDWELRPTDDQIRALDDVARMIRATYPVYPIFGRGGGGVVTGCDAAGRIMHITAKGDVEPCVFVPWAADNILEKTLAEVLQSDFFQRIRGLAATGDSRVTPCKWAKSPLLTNLLNAGAKNTQEGV